MRKAQQALEFLTTYGWMLLVLLIVLTALSITFFNTPRPVACAFPATFVCRGWKLTTYGNLTLDLQQNTGHPTTILGINCTKNSDLSNPTFTGINVYIKNNDHALVANGTNIRCLDINGAPISGNLGSFYTGKIALYYIENNTGMSHVIVGDITAKLE